MFVEKNVNKQGVCNPVSLAKCTYYRLDFDNVSDERIHTYVARVNDDERARCKIEKYKFIRGNWYFWVSGNQKDFKTLFMQHFRDGLHICKL